MNDMADGARNYLGVYLGDTARQADKAQQMVLALAEAPDGDAYRGEGGTALVGLLGLIGPMATAAKQIGQAIAVEDQVIDLHLRIRNMLAILSPAEARQGIEDALTGYETWRGRL